MISIRAVECREHALAVASRPLEPKELVTIPGARHIDLYDRTDLIPFETLETFFAKNLAQ